MKKLTPLLLLLLFSTPNLAFKTIPNQDEESVFVKVDKMPEFPGGQVAMVKYVSKNIRYPKKSKSKISGRVLVSFVVDKTGKVINPKIIKGLSKEYDQEALRIVGDMPYWIPGEKEGKKVDVVFNLPIQFN